MMLADMLFVLIPILVLLLCFALVLVLLTRFFAPWLQAFMSGTPISIMNIIGMHLRKVDAKQVIRSAIMATQAGCPIPVQKLESAYLQGVDLEKVTLAYIEAHRQERDYAFEQFVDAERNNRLEELLG